MPMMRDVIVQDQSGLHAGIAGALYQIVKEQKVFGFIRYRNKTANMKDFMKVLALGVKKQETITLIVDGDNEETAIQLMSDLIEGKKGD